MLLRTRELFEPFGEPLSEVLKLAALLLFGATLSPQLLDGLGTRAVVFAALALVVARPVGLLVSLLGTRLSRRETAAAAWLVRKGSPQCSSR